MLDFIQEHLVLSICILAIIVSLISIFVILIVKRKPSKTKINHLYDSLIEGFGGLDNIIEVSAKASRLSLTLKDYSLVNDQLLKEKGVTSSIKMSNKITFVIGEQAKDIENHILSKQKK